MKRRWPFIKVLIDVINIIASLLALIIILTIIFIFLFPSKVRYTGTDKEKFGNFIQVVSKLSTTDSTIVAAPNPHKLYPAGRTPKTIYSSTSAAHTTDSGFLIREKVELQRGPAILLKVDKNTQAIYPYNGINLYTNFVFLKGTKKIQLFFHINPKYLSQYRYRILINDTTFIHWQQPQATTLLKDLFPALVDSSVYSTERRLPKSIKEKRKQARSVLLADMNAYNKKITLQLYNLNNPKGTSTVILYNKPLNKPVISGIKVSIGKDSGNGEWGTTFTLNYDTTSASHISNHPTPKIHLNELKKLTIKINRIVTTGFYSVYIKNTSALFPKIYRIRPAPQTSDYIFDAIPHGGSLSINNPENIITKPGAYKITVIPELPHYRLRFFDKAASVEFTVLPATSTKEKKAFTFTQVIIYLGLLVLAGVLFFWWYRTRQQKKLRESKHQSALAKAQLNSVRLQLNPHFVFNALSSIQNLMNKKDIDNANRYLGKFSRLTRSVLGDDFKESIPIADELRLLDDYLKMEQLRFGFQYSIHADENIDAENTEIPSMLFQPFVENAVKYGVYQKESEGIIRIDVLQKEKDIILRVTDNGNGFDTEKEYDGLGIKLSRSRIDLLNSLQKSTEITLDLKSGKEGTIVVVYLKNWI